MQEIYPSAPSGRVWTLPDLPAGFDSQWLPESNNVGSVAPGRYHTEGQVRLNIASPEGANWWRDIEMTAYFYETGTIADPSQTPHWELFARGERHSHNPVLGSDVNGGHHPPAGTETWPGYPFGSGSVKPECLGTAYHGNIYPDARIQFEKEISHTEGYSATRRNQGYVSGFKAPLERWFGLKFITYNLAAGGVHLELWLDAEGDDRWAQVAETEDTGGWVARDPNIDGCGALPFGYRDDQILSWAGPYATFRADALAFDFKWLSIREITPPAK